MAKKYVLTGGPSTGKTTLLSLATKPGIYTISEVATYIIEKEKRNGGNTLPWINKDAFQKKVLETQLRWEEEIPDGVEKALLDRGVPDGIAYYLIDGQTPPQILLDAAKQTKYEQVFLVEQLDNYENTEIRREDKARGEALHRQVAEVYKGLGYKPITLPKMPKQERVNWLLGKL